MIGMVFIALSDLMYGFGQTDLAARFGEDALRYTYLTDASESVSSCHNNLGVYLKKMGSLKALIHGLAAATTRLLTHSGRLPPTLLNLSIDLTTFGPEAFPASFDQLCKTVEEVDGVKFKDLFFQLAGPDADGDEMMKTVLQMAQENREG